MRLRSNGENNGGALAAAALALFPCGWSRRLRSHNTTSRGLGGIFPLGNFSEKVPASVPPQRWKC